MHRPLFMAMLLAIALYVGVVAYFHARQRAMLYFPQYTRVPVAATDFALPRPDAMLRGWVLNPGRTRAVLYFGGNGEAIQFNRPDFAAWFPEHTVYLLAYRGYGASEGEPREAAMLADALALFDRVQRDHRGIEVIGRSLGGAVATYVASKRPVTRLALITPFDSAANVAQQAFPWLPVSLLLQDRHDAMRRAASVRCPVLVIVAGADEVIPAARTDALVSAFSTPPKLVRIAAAGHNDIQDSVEFGRALRQFLAESEQRRDAHQASVSDRF